MKLTITEDDKEHDKEHKHKHKHHHHHHRGRSSGHKRHGSMMIRLSKEADAAGFSPENVIIPADESPQKVKRKLNLKPTSRRHPSIVTDGTSTSHFHLTLPSSGSGGDDDVISVRSDPADALDSSELNLGLDTARGSIGSMNLGDETSRSPNFHPERAPRKASDDDDFTTQLSKTDWSKMNLLSPPLIVSRTLLETYVKTSLKWHPSHRRSQTKTRLNRVHLISAARAIWKFRMKRMQGQMTDAIQKLIFLVEEANAINAVLDVSDRYRVELTSILSNVDHLKAQSPMLRIRQLRHTVVGVSLWENSSSLVPLRTFDLDMFLAQLDLLRNRYALFVNRVVGYIPEEKEMEMALLSSSPLSSSFPHLGQALVYLEPLRYAYPVNIKAPVMDSRGCTHGILHVRLELCSTLEPDDSPRRYSNTDPLNHHRRHSHSSSGTHRRGSSMAIATPPMLYIFALKVTILSYTHSDTRLMVDEREEKNTLSDEDREEYIRATQQHRKRPIGSLLTIKYRILDDPHVFATSSTHVDGDRYDFSYTQLHYLHGSNVASYLLQYLQYDALVMDIYSHEDAQHRARSMRKSRLDIRMEELVGEIRANKHSVSGITLEPEHPPRSPSSKLPVVSENSVQIEEEKIPPKLSARAIMPASPRNSGKLRLLRFIRQHNTVVAPLMIQTIASYVSADRSVAVTRTSPIKKQMSVSARKRRLSTIPSSPTDVRRQLAKEATSLEYQNQATVVKNAFYVVVDVEGGSAPNSVAQAPLKSDLDATPVLKLATSHTYRRVIISIVQVDQKEMAIESFHSITLDSLSLTTTTTSADAIQPNQLDTPVELDIVEQYTDDPHRLVVAAASWPESLLKHQLFQTTSTTGQRVQAKFTIRTYLHATLTPMTLSTSLQFKIYRIVGTAKPMLHRMARLGSPFTVTRSASAQTVQLIFKQFATTLELRLRALRTVQLEQHALVLDSLMNQVDQEMGEKELCEVDAAFKESLDSLLRACLPSIDPLTVLRFQHPYDAPTDVTISVTSHPRQASQHCGFLLKKKRTGSQYITKWVVTRLPYLYYYKTKDAPQHEIIPLLGSSIRGAMGDEPPHSFTITTVHRSFTFQAASSQDLTTWITILASVASYCDTPINMSNDPMLIPTLTSPSGISATSTSPSTRTSQSTPQLVLPRRGTTRVEKAKALNGTPIDFPTTTSTNGKH